jgi:hypothetical protein
MSTELSDRVFAFLEKLVVGIGEVSEITEIPIRQNRY